MLDPSCAGFTIRGRPNRAATSAALSAVTSAGVSTATSVAVASAGCGGAGGSGGGANGHDHLLRAERTGIKATLRHAVGHGIDAVGAGEDDEVVRAHPGKGGVLPGKKVTAEIARIRGIEGVLSVRAIPSLEGAIR